MSRKQAIAAIKVVLLVIIAVILQTVLVSRVSVMGISADLFLIFTVIMAISRGPTGGCVFGFFAGLAADVAYLAPLGVRAFVYVVTGYALGLLAERFGPLNLWGVFLFTAGSAFVARCVFGLFQYVMGPREGLLTMLGLQMVPGVLLDALVAVPIYVALLHTRVISLPRVESPPGGSASE